MPGMFGPARTGRSCCRLLGDPRLECLGRQGSDARRRAARGSQRRPALGAEALSLRMRRTARGAAHACAPASSRAASAHSSRSSHGVAASRSKTSRASSRSGAASAGRPRAASHSPCSSSVTASQNTTPISRKPAAAAWKPRRRRLVPAGKERAEAIRLGRQVRRLQPRRDGIDPRHELDSPPPLAERQRGLDCLDQPLLDALRSDPERGARQLDGIDTGGDRVGEAALGTEHGGEGAQVAGAILDVGRVFQVPEEGAEPDVPRPGCRDAPGSRAPSRAGSW